MKKTPLYFCLFLMIVIYSCHPNPKSIYSNQSANTEDRISALVSAMTLDEKVKLVAGTDYWNTNSIPRLKIPSMKSMNGPYGVRPYFKTPEYPAGVPDSIKATAFPVNVAMGATWNPELIRKTAIALAQETKGKGHHILLAPCINIQRVPFGGRNFESFSEDPFLTSKMAVAFVKGVQSEKVIPTVKHFACNNTELNRFNVNMVVDERALHEIYLPAFKASVTEAKAWGFMSAFVKINGDFGSDSRYLLDSLLKKEWGFQGFVMSDWGAVHNTVKTANAGLDIEMPEPKFFGEQLKNAVANGEVKEKMLDDKVRRILRPMFECGFYDEPVPQEEIDSTSHRELAYQLAAESIVLLKNEENILPLDKDKLKKIAVIGPNANVARMGGDGSSVVIPFRSVTTFDGIKSEAGEQTEVQFTPGVVRDEDVLPIDSKYFRTPEGKPGLKAEYFNNPEFMGNPSVTKNENQINFDWATESPLKGINPDNFSIRWTGSFTPDFSGDYEIGLGSNDQAHIYINDELLVDNPGKHSFSVKWSKISLKKEIPLRIKAEYTDYTGKASMVLGIRKYIPNPLEEAVQIAKKSDVVIICVGFSSYEESEGQDIQSLFLPSNQLALIRKVKEVNPRAIVVLNSGTPLFISDWVDEVPALLEAWYPGQEGGRAVADILFGKVNPSGKLPQSWPVQWADSPAFKWYPNPDTQSKIETNIDDNTGAGENKEMTLEYGEGIYVGYRYFEKTGIKPLFPFGYGLSYTSFEYNNLIVPNYFASDSISISFTLKNIGLYEGAEVAQLYIQPEETLIDRPVKELKAFKKIMLQPGEAKVVSINLGRKDFAYYNVECHSWVTNPGNYTLWVGTTSSDRQLHGSITIK